MLSSHFSRSVTPAVRLRMRQPKLIYKGCRSTLCCVTRCLSYPCGRRCPSCTLDYAEQTFALVIFLSMTCDVEPIKASSCALMSMSFVASLDSAKGASTLRLERPSPQLALLQPGCSLWSVPSISTLENDREALHQLFKSWHEYVRRLSATSPPACGMFCLHS